MELKRRSPGRIHVDAPFGSIEVEWNAIDGRLVRINLSEATIRLPSIGVTTSDEAIAKVFRSQYSGVRINTELNSNSILNSEYWILDSLQNWGFARASDIIHEWLRRYFQGSPAPLPHESEFHLESLPEFTRRVLRELRNVPWGKTESYGALAAAVGAPGAARAVGTALGRNPFPILYPCHRIIAADGSLGGFSCGIKIKQWLLNHEAQSEADCMVAADA